MEALRAAFRAGVRSQVLCAPTGSGKTVMGAELCRAALEKGSRVWFVCDRQVLVEQTSAEFDRFGLPHGIVMGAATRDSSEDLLVCSAQTLINRTMPDPDMVIVDESHIQFTALLRRFRDARIPQVGLSATPLTRGLGRWYQNTVTVRPTNALIEEGYLAPVKLIVPQKMVDGRLLEYDAHGEVTAASSGRAVIQIVGDVLVEWEKRVEVEWGGRRVPTLIFAATIADAESLCQRFQEAGHDFRLYTSRTPADARRDAVRALRTGESIGLISVEAATRGFDVPGIECVVMCRTYSNSLAQVVQQIGRGMRTAPGKERCVVIDHAGNIPRQYSELFRFWADGPGALDTSERKKKKKAKVLRPRECHECGAVQPPASLICPVCGAVPHPPQTVSVIDGELDEFEAQAFEPKAILTKEEIAASALASPWPHICGLARERLRKGFYRDADDPDAKALSWGRAQYKNLLGKWPPRTSLYESVYEVPDTRPHPAVRAAVRENMERWKREQGFAA